jgi:hypothetical protein
VNGLDLALDRFKQIDDSAVHDAVLGGFLVPLS